tara:strand:+ start:623 stop:2086 length:1464 start_codon:yes stop_codon:yes gene_type:complete
MHKDISDLSLKELVFDKLLQILLYLKISISCLFYFSIAMLKLINLNKDRSLIIRSLIYLFIGIIYYYFMSHNAPLGIDWVHFHKVRVVNSIENILNFNTLLKYGLTTETPPAVVTNSLASGEPFQMYLTSFHTYIHLVFAHLIGGRELSIIIGQNLDRLAIFLGAVFTAEISRVFITPTKSIGRNLIAVSAFSIFLSSPWSYRMVIGAWLEVYFLLFLLISQLCFIYKRKKIGILFLFLACLSQYQWGFFLFVFYLSILLIGSTSRNISKIRYLFPPDFDRPKDKIFLLLICVIPSILFMIANIRFNLNNTQILSGNSSIFYRVGIDSLANVHHGGWLGSLQFLGGNRISICLPNQQLSLNIVKPVENQIYLFNCSLSIIGTFLLSFFSIIGCLYLHIKNKHIRFITFPISFSLFSFALIFQQSFAAHLQGYSFVYVFIFVLGIISTIGYCISRWGSRYYSELIYIPIVFAIIINNLRVSYLTGVNG